MRGNGFKWWILGLPAVVSIYFCIGLAPNWFPHLGRSRHFRLYLLSLAYAALALGLLAVVTGSMVIWRRARRRQPSPALRSTFFATSLSLVSLAAVAAIAQLLFAGLPYGSRLAQFDPVEWRRLTSAQFVQGDITPRQRMLGDLVESFLPGRSRAEIESNLGPSLDTAYFAETGRDLIFVLGQERDLFLSIDSEWLLIWLDSGGRFERYAIRTD